MMPYIALMLLTVRAVAAIVRYYNEQANDNNTVTGAPVTTVAPKPNGVSG
ncbi:MAG: hypothetical protein U0V74_09300 [Chitinophagales bacterium]